MTETCVSAQRYDLARKAGTLFKTVVNPKTPAASLNRVNIYLAYCEREAGEWQKARASFEALGSLNMAMTAPGPWGKLPFYFKAEQAAYECRQHLGIAGPPPAAAPKPKKESPAQFSLNKAVLRLGKEFVFVCDGDQIWLGDGVLPFVCDKSGGNLIEIEVPEGIERNISCIAPGKTSVWFGTAGSGLVKLEKVSKKTTLYHEGLLLPNITSLLLTEQRLWIGYGRGQDGGLGYLDLQKIKFYGMTPQLDSNSVLPFAFSSVSKTFVQTPFAIAPKEKVVGIVQASPEELWLAVQHLGIQRYSFINNQWNLSRNEWNSLNNGIVPCRTLKFLAVKGDYLIFGGDDYGGRLGIWNRKRQETRLVELNEWLPEWVLNNYRFKGFCCVALDGDHVWAGGEGFLALIDLASTRVEKLCDLREGHIHVHGLQVDGGDLWVAAEDKLYRLPKDSPLTLSTR